MSGECTEEVLWTHPRGYRRLVKVAGGFEVHVKDEVMGIPVNEWRTEPLLTGMVRCAVENQRTGGGVPPEEK